MWLTFAVIACSIVAYATEKWSIEGISLASIVALLIVFVFVPQTGDAQVTAASLLEGFANPALITVLALLVLGQSLFNTDALEAPTRWLTQLGGQSNLRTIFAILVVTVATSAFLNNTPVVVMLIPIVLAIAAKRDFSASRVLMPLSFAGILGGMITLIGSSTNLLVAGVANRYGVQLGFFDFAVPGLIIAVIGIVYLMFVLPWILGNNAANRGKHVQSSGRQFVSQIHIDENHPLRGMKSAHGLFPQLQDLTIRSIQRDGDTVLPPFEDLELRAGDVMVVAATRNALMAALASGAASLPRISPDAVNNERASDQLDGVVREFTVAEAVVAPGSRYAGRTVDASRIRVNYGTMILGVQRRSAMTRGLVRDIRLEPGDTLLVGGLNEDLERLRESRDLLLLERSALEVPLRKKAPFAITIFALVIFMSATGMAPIVAASMIGAYAVIATGCLSIRQAARSFDRQIFMMVGASLASATALEQTGGAAYLAGTVVDALAGFSTIIVLSALFAATALLTNVLSNNATAVLFTPIAIGIAQQLNAPIEPFVICIILAANCSFATPVGYQTNLLVMGPGKYQFRDFLRAGLPLVFIVWLTFSLIAPLLYSI